MPDLDTPSPNLRGAEESGARPVADSLPAPVAGCLTGCLRRRHGRRRRGLNELRGKALLTLEFIYGASGFCAVLLFVYLGYALIRAEKF
ncbi:K+-transporting ATPase subunit F [Pseudomonas sp. Os17]|nr:K+-transporting ATPase subunit F [Pseudomonas sp. Os17]